MPDAQETLPWLPGAPARGLSRDELWSAYRSTLATAASLRRALARRGESIPCPVCRRPLTRRQIEAGNLTCGRKCGACLAHGGY